jgi:hypothetical protein
MSVAGGKPRAGLVGDAFWGASCAAFGGTYAWALYALNHRAFFNDDSQEAFAPIFMAIGRALGHGHWPVLTLQMLNGGALASEYQYAIYNPFSLFACWVASQFADQATAEAMIAGLHYAVLGAGAFAFARACGANRPFAALAGVAFVANNFLYYWLAESWITGLVSIAWMTWALAGIIKAHQSRWAWVGGAVATALTVTSGCYHTVVMLGMATAVIALVRWRTEGVRQAIAPLVSAALGVLLALIAVLPVLAMSAVTVRNGGLNNAGQLAVDLYGVLAPSSPFHTGHIVDFDGPARLAAPIYFAGWFLLPLLPLIDWKKLGRPSPTLIALVGMAAVFVIATQGPEQVFSIRYPIWNLAPLHLALLAAFALVASKAGFAELSRPRVWGVVGIAYFGWLASLQVQPEMRLAAFAAALAICALAVIGGLLNRRWAGGYAAVGIVGVALFAAATHLAIRTNHNQLDRRPPTAASAISDLTAIPASAGVFLGNIDEAKTWQAPEIETAAMALAHGGSNPFGYSPVGHEAFSRLFWIQLWGTPLTVGIGRPFAPSGYGQTTWVDLLRVDQVVIPKVGDRPARIAAQAGTRWREAAERPYTVTLQRAAPAARGPGSLAWTSPGLVVAPVGLGTAEAETLKISARAGHGDRLVFDRLAVPGYSLAFNGRPLPLNLTATPLMTVALPDGPDLGALTIRYAPPGWGLGLAAALLALTVLVVGWARWPALFGTAAKPV